MVAKGPGSIFTICNALQCHLIPNAALTQSIENELARWRIEPKNLQHSAFDHGATLKMERKTSHLDIAFDRYASVGHAVGTVMHYILVISDREGLRIKQPLCCIIYTIYDE